MTEEEGKELVTLQTELIEPPVLELSRRKGRCTVDTDAFNA